MPFSLNSQMMRQIIIDNYEHPQNKRTPNDDRYLKLHMHTTSCADDFHLYILFENDRIVDCAFDGVGCAISTASLSIMTQLLIGKSLVEAQQIIDAYLNMIYERPYDPQLLEEAIVFMNTYKQPGRIKCATIGFEGAQVLIKQVKHEQR